MFAGEPRQDIQEAFQSARAVLAEISTLSQQAKVYNTILGDFADAVDRYRQRVSLEIRRTVEHYLDTTPFVRPATRRPSEERHGGGVAEGGAGLGLGEGDAELQINWADLDLYLVDQSLMPAVEPFQDFFCSVE